MLVLDMIDLNIYVLCTCKLTTSSWKVYLLVHLCIMYRLRKPSLDVFSDKGKRREE